LGRLAERDGKKEGLRKIGLIRGGRGKGFSKTIKGKNYEGGTDLRTQTKAREARKGFLQPSPERETDLQKLAQKKAPSGGQNA